MKNTTAKPELTPLEQFAKDLRSEAKKYGLAHLKAVKENISFLPVLKRDGIPQDEVINIIDNVTTDYKLDLMSK